MACLTLTKQRCPHVSVESPIVSPNQFWIEELQSIQSSPNHPSMKWTVATWLVLPISWTLWSSCSVAGTLLAFCKLDAIMKHCRTICCLRVSSPPFFTRNRMRRRLVKMIVSNLFNPSHPRMALYAEGSRTTVKVKKIVLSQDEVLAITRRVISLSILTKSLKKPTKDVKIHFSWLSNRFIQIKAS